MNNEFNKIKKIIKNEYEKGNIVFNTIEGLAIANLKDFIKQPADGILYDLNRLEEVVLQFIDEEKWINDYACCKVIRELKNKIEKLEASSNEQL